MNDPAPAPISRLYIFGAGGHGREIGWLAREAHADLPIEYVVDDAYLPAAPVNGIPLRALSDVPADPTTGYVAAVGDPALRERVAKLLTSLGIRPVALVHPRAERTPNVRIGVGTVVCAGSVLTDNVHIGDHAVVNIGCTLSHDVRLGAFATLSPGVHIAGNVVIGERATIGIGANIINGTPSRPLVIGPDSLVAAGATVIHDVAAGTVVGGVPARLLHRGVPE